MIWVTSVCIGVEKATRCSRSGVTTRPYAIRSPTPWVNAGSSWSGRTGRNVTFTFKGSRLELLIHELLEILQGLIAHASRQTSVIEKCDGAHQDQRPYIAVLCHFVEVAGTMPEDRRQRNVTRWHRHFVRRRCRRSRHDCLRLCLLGFNRRLGFLSAARSVKRVPREETRPLKLYGNRWRF